MVGAPQGPTTRDAVAEAFARADLDGSGYVEIGELRFALDELGLRVSDEGAAAIVTK